MPALLAEVTRAWEAAIAVVFAAESSTQEAVAARDNAALCVKDKEDRAALAERVVLENISRVEAENAKVLASIREDVEGYVQKITLLEGELVVERWAQEVSKRERREQFEELTLL
jgi:hypothetical protein